MARDDRMLKTLVSLIEGGFSFLIALVDIIFKVILLIGALTSMALLYKLFPDIAVPIYTALLPVFEILFFIIKIVVIFLIAFLIAFIFFSFEKMGKDIIKKRERGKKEFIDELIVRMKKEKTK